MVNYIRLKDPPYKFTSHYGKSVILPLFVGIIFGFGFGFIFSNTQEKVIKIFTTINAPEGPHVHSRHTEIEENDANNFEAIIHHSSDEEGHKGTDTVAKALAEKVKVLCWVLTNPNAHKEKDVHIKNTWGRRCNKLFFGSSKEDKEIGAVALFNTSEGRNHLWGKTQQAFKLAYESLNEFDWFMKADDDTYVVMENLRYLLKDFNPNDPIWFGCRFTPYLRTGYMSGGAGYILSREALRRLVEVAFKDGKNCRISDDQGAEDVEIGKCLESVGVEGQDSRDQYGRHRFMPFVPQDHVTPGHINMDYWYWKNIWYPQKQGMDCCSDTSITFHYISPKQMYVLEFLIYHLKPYGITHNFPVQTVRESKS